MKQEYIDVLTKTPLFAGIGRDGVSKIMACMSPAIHSYQKNEYVALENDPFAGIGCVLLGEAAVVKENAAGDRIIMEIVEPSGLFGEMAAWVDDRRWPATVQALEPSSMIFLPPERISCPCEKTCDYHISMIENMLKILAEKSIALIKKVDSLAMKTLRGKLCFYFLEQARLSGKTTFTMPLNRNELADFLGVTRPSMSREMGRLRDEGIIDFHMATVKIKDINSLKKAAE